MKHHILHTSCANNHNVQQPLRWNEIVQANIPNTQNMNDNEINNREKSIFDKTELLFGRITITNTPAGTIWKCTADGCTYDTEGKQRIRNHLSKVHRVANTGSVNFPYCDKNTHTYWQPQTTPRWIYWGKCVQITNGKTGEEIWFGTIRRNPRNN